MPFLNTKKHSSDEISPNSIDCDAISSFSYGIVSSGNTDKSEDGELDSQGSLEKHRKP